MKKNLFVSSVLTIVLCLSMIVGSAYALFTDNDQVNSTITAGSMDVQAKVENLELSSLLGTPLPESSATYEGGNVILRNIVPGDVVKFDLHIQNSSSITIRYRSILTVLDDDGLWDGLEVYVGGVAYDGGRRFSNWAVLVPEADDVIIPIRITLPVEAGNEYQSRRCTFACHIEAVQGNANVYGSPLSDGIYYDASTQTYGISNAQGMHYLAALSAEGENFAGKKVELLNDIDLQWTPWTPIKSFAGEFDGRHHRISNLKISVDDCATRGGLFDVIEGGDGERVHDLIIENVRATVGEGRFGTLANSVQGIVNRVTVRNVQVTTTSEQAWVGGMCAFMYWPWMNDCTVENLRVDAVAGAAFVAGFSPILQKNSNMVFSNCNVKGFQVNICSESGAQVGGFAGQTQRGWEYPALENCAVTGIDIVAAGNVSIGGFIANPGAHTTLKNCRTEGKIDATGLTEGEVGGFLGDLGWNDDLGAKGGHQITDCIAKVDIVTNVASAGGFVGSATNSNNRSMPATFQNCTAEGSVRSVGSAHIGGFAGEADRGTYVHCTVNGTIGGQAAGEDNFIGYIRENADITIRN